MFELNSSQKEKIIRRGTAAFGAKFPTGAYQFQKQRRLMDLQNAIRNHDMENIRRIVKDDPEIINRQLVGSKRFPILLAMQYKNEEAIVFFLKKHPNLLLTSDQGETVLNALPKVKSKRLRNKLQKSYTFQFSNAVSKRKILLGG